MLIDTKRAFNCGKCITTQLSIPLFDYKIARKAALQQKNIDVP